VIVAIPGLGEKNEYWQLVITSERNLPITSGKDDFFRSFVIPAKAGIQGDFELLLDSGFRRNDMMPQSFLRSYL